MQRVPLLGAVGPLQFEVVQYRLQSEYNAESRLEIAPYKHIRWLSRKDGGPWTDEGVNLPTDTTLARDAEDRPVALLADAWAERFFATRNETLEISEEPPK
jgi:peptide chain release factor 3